MVKAAYFVMEFVVGKGSTADVPVRPMIQRALWFSVFEKIASPEGRNILLAFLGCIQDGIQDCLDDIQYHLGLPLLFNFQPQVDAYASHI
jgi:hypothetical protein